MSQFTYKNHSITIEYDSDSENPRAWDAADTLAVYHRNYDFGDKKLFNDPEDLQAWLIDQGAAVHWLPVYMYEHGGVTISASPFGCRFDSGQIGVIYISAETAKKEGINDPIAYMKGSIADLDTWLRGEVYMYRIENDEGDFLDACGSYFGEDYCISEAKALVDFYDSKIPKQLELFAA